MIKGEGLFEGLFKEVAAVRLRNGGPQSKIVAFHQWKIFSIMVDGPSRFNT
jgi:hypothetical protein